jgi:hypothetical protein
MPGSSGPTLCLRFHASPDDDLSQEGDPHDDQQQEANQEENPRHIGHAVAKPVLVTCPVRNIGD